jgi:hypothetical protein
MPYDKGRGSTALKQAPHLGRCHSVQALLLRLAARVEDSRLETAWQHCCALGTLSLLLLQRMVALRLQLSVGKCRGGLGTMQPRAYEWHTQEHVLCDDMHASSHFGGQPGCSLAAQTADHADSCPMAARWRRVAGLPVTVRCTYLWTGAYARAV